MSKTNNIIAFSLLFHKVVKDSYLVNSHISYIWEKYQSMIGFDPIVRNDEFSDWWQGVVLRDFEAMSLKLAWMAKWNRSNETIDPKKERVLNYLCMINTMKVTPENLFYVFEEYIGKIDDVTPIEYKHIHPLLRKFIDNYKERNRREFNLEILSR